MGRSSDARNRLIDSATERFYQRGYNSVGVNEICRAAGVKKGSFYYFFPSKRVLLLEVIEGHARRYRELMDRALGEDVSPPERVHRLFQLIYQHHRSVMAATGRMNGCPVGNLALELSAHDGEVREKLDAIFGEWSARLEPVVRQARAANNAENGAPERTAAAIVAYLEGIAVLATTRNDPELFGLLARRVHRLLEGDGSSTAAAREQEER